MSETHTTPPATAAETVAPALLLVEEVARILRCSETHIRRLVHLGLLAACRIGCGIRIRLADVERLLAEHPATGPDPRRDPRRHGKVPTGRPPRSKGRRG